MNVNPGQPGHPANTDAEGGNRGDPRRRTTHCGGRRVTRPTADLVAAAGLGLLTGWPGNPGEPTDASAHSSEVGHAGGGVRPWSDRVPSDCRASELYGSIGRYSKSLYPPIGRFICSSGPATRPTRPRLGPPRHSGCGPASTAEAGGHSWPGNPGEPTGDPTSRTHVLAGQTLSCPPH